MLSFNGVQSRLIEGKIMYFLYFITLLSQIYCSIYTFKRLLNLSNPTKDTPWVDLCCSIILAGLLAGLEFVIPSSRVLLLTMILLCLGSGYYNQRFNTAFAAAVISVGFSFLFYDIGAAASYPLAFAASENAGAMTDDMAIRQICRIVACLIQLVLNVLVFKIPRLKKGMPFLQRDNIKDAGIIVGLLLVMGSVFVRDVNMIQYHLGVVLACGMTLFVWWNNKLQAAYQDKQKDIRIQTLEQEVEQYQQEEAERDEREYSLSRQIHEDRRIIPALYSQLQYLTEIATFENDAAEKEYRKSVEAMNAVIQKQYEQAASYEDTHKAIPSTGVAGADIMIRYMADKAIAQGVSFDCVVERDLNILLDCVSEYNLSIILGDLIGNALRAVKTTEQKSILLKIHEVKNLYCAISVYDSGVDFSPETIRRLGRQRATTHPEDGGSGIGLMSTFEIVHACYGTYELDETIDEPPFTKVVTIRFDFRNRTYIRTHRDEIMDVHEDRSDFIFLRKQEDRKEESFYLDSHSIHDGGEQHDSARTDRMFYRTSQDSTCQPFQN